MKLALQAWQGRGHPERRLLLTVRGGYHGDTAGAMSVCDPVTGMHGLFRGYVPQQLFVERPAAARTTSRCRTSDLDEVRAAARRPRAPRSPRSSSSRSCRAPAACASTRPTTCARSSSCAARTTSSSCSTRSPPASAAAGRCSPSSTPASYPDVLCLGKALTGGYLSLGRHAVHRRGRRRPSAPRRAGRSCTGRPSWATRWRAPSRRRRSTCCCGQDWSARIAHTRRPTARAGSRRPATCPGVADVRVLGAIGVVELDGAGRPGRHAAAARRARRLGPPVRPAGLHDAAVHQHRRRPRRS